MSCLEARQHKRCVNPETCWKSVRSVGAVIEKCHEDNGVDAPLPVLPHDTLRILYECFDLHLGADFDSVLLLVFALFDELAGFTEAKTGKGDGDGDSGANVEEDLEAVLGLGNDTHVEACPES